MGVPVRGDGHQEHVGGVGGALHGALHRRGIAAALGQQPPARRRRRSGRGGRRRPPRIQRHLPGQRPGAAAGPGGHRGRRQGGLPPLHGRCHADPRGRYAGPGLGGGGGVRGSIPGAARGDADGAARVRV